MSLRLLPCGERAILVELADGPQRRRFVAGLRAARLPYLLEHVPAARTVLARVHDPGDLPRLAADLRELAGDAPRAAGADPPGPTVTIEVAYDGPDLAVVAEHLGVSERAVVDRHTGQEWTCDFAGFLPGFGYLVGDGADLDVPRRASPRTRVPAGSVGLAGPYSGVYPRESPGGWQLIGTTRAAVWDPHRDPPALLSPGTRVRFVEIRR